MNKPEVKRLLVSRRGRSEDNKKYFFKEWGLGRGLKLCSLVQEQVLYAFECDKGNSVYINCWEFLDLLATCYRVKKNYA